MKEEEIYKISLNSNAKVMVTFHLSRQLKISIKFQKEAVKKSVKLEWSVDTAVKASVTSMKSPRQTQLVTTISDATKNV